MQTAACFRVAFKGGLTVLADLLELVLEFVLEPVLELEDDDELEPY